MITRNMYGPISRDIGLAMANPSYDPDMLGYLPGWLDPANPAPAREQFDAAYKQYGGWKPFQKLKLTTRGLEYPGDPPLPLLATAKLRDEKIGFYKSGWTVIWQADGSYEIAKLD